MFSFNMRIYPFLLNFMKKFLFLKINQSFNIFLKLYRNIPKLKYNPLEKQKLEKSHKKA